MNKYAEGKQPCANFKPQREANAYADWNNVHECIFCDDNTVSWCENCLRDHHANGYETCQMKGLPR